MPTSIVTPRIPVMTMLGMTLLLVGCDMSGSMSVDVSNKGTNIGLQAKDRETGISLKSKYNVDNKEGSVSIGWEFIDGSLECALEESHSEFIEGIENNEQIDYRFEMTEGDCGVLTVTDAAGNSTELDCCAGIDR